MMARLKNTAALFLAVIALVMVFAGLFPLAAQEAATQSGAAQGDDEKSKLLSYVENQLSTPDRQIRLNGLKGALSSDVSLDSITIADTKGIWLKITNPKLVWSRLALLRGDLKIDTLSAERIDWYRQGETSEQLPTPEATPFTLPDLPVSINIGELSIGEIHLDQSLFGLQAVASVDGKASLANGELDLDLAIERRDGAGGEFTVIAQYANEKRHLNLDLKLDEPENGILANLMKLEGRPPVSLTLKGNDPVDDLNIALAFDVASNRILDGGLHLVRQDRGSFATVEVDGPLSSILPQRMRQFFGPRSSINARALFQDAGGVDLEALSLDSGALRLDANGKTLSDGFLAAFNLNGELSPQGQARIDLPVSEGKVSLASASLNVNYDAQQDSNWNGSLILDDIKRDDMEIKSISVKSSGMVENVNDPQNRSLTFDLNGLLSGFSASDPALETAVGKTISLDGTGQWKSGNPLLLNAFRIAGETWNTVISGQVEEMAFDGSIVVNAERLAAFAPIAKRDLRGKGAFRAQGRIKPLDGAFNLILQGDASGLALGEPFLDPLLASDTRLNGGVARDERGLAFNNFKVTNQEFETTLDGRFASDRSDLEGDVLIRNLVTVNKRASGPLRLTASLKGEQKPFDLVAELGMDRGELAGRKVEALKLALTGTYDFTSFVGRLSSSGKLDGKPLEISAQSISATGEAARLDGLLLNVGQARVSGDLIRTQNGLVDGALAINAANIGDLASLFLVKANGAINGSVQLQGKDGKQDGNLDLEMKQISYEGNELENARINATFADLFGTPGLDGTIKARNLLAGGTRITRLDGKIATVGNKTDFDLQAALDVQSSKIEARGDVTRESGFAVVALDVLQINSALTKAHLASPAKIRVQDGTAEFSNATLVIGDGTLSLDGQAGKKMNLTTKINALPLSIINAIQPEAKARGSISGHAEITGTSANMTGRFDLSGSAISVAQLEEANIAPLAIAANGKFAGKQINLARLTVKNSQNLDIAASGNIPFVGNGLSLNIEGTAPLAAAQGFLDSRGATLSGTARARIGVTGSLQNPLAKGLVTVSDGVLVDPLSNLKLVGIGVLASIDGKTINLNKAEARFSTGGSVSANGTIGLTPEMPVNLAVALKDAEYTDGQTIWTKASGQLKLSGSLTRDPLLQGTINLQKTDIAVPETFGSNDDLLNVKHVRPSPKVIQTLERLKQASPQRKPTERPSIMRLDVTINAPNQIFVRGRGLDAELGGSVRVLGSTVAVEPIGNFSLRRGRLIILGKRLDFDSGTITLNRELLPVLDLTARTSTGDVIAFVHVKGEASEPQVTFTSTPELPQDEVLALIIFGHGIGELSPIQIIRLASIASELTGGKNPGLVNGIRKGTGLDDLDIVEDADGNAAVQTGKYISDNVYLGVQAGQKSKATINLDITDNVKVRGSIGTESESSIGIFLEKDY